MKKLFCLLLSLMLLLPAAAALADNQVGGEFHDGLAFFQQGDLYGFIDTRGNVVIEPAYHQAVNFENGYASVNVGTKNGSVVYNMIDTTGTIVAKPTAANGQNYYMIVEWFGDIGIQEKRSRKEDKYKNWTLGYQYVNGSGKTIGSTVYLYASPFDEEGFAVVGTGKIKAKTATVSQARAHFLAYLNGNAYTQSADTYYYIDRKGKQLGKLKFSTIPHAFSEGLAAVPGKPNAKGESTWGYIDTKGKTVIPEQFSYAGEFHDGVAKVAVGGRYGMIDREGNFVIEPKWDAMGDFSEGYAIVKQGDLYTLIDKTGNPVFEPRWAMIGPVTEGLAYVKEPGENGKYGYINTAGEVVAEPHYDAAYSFKDGYAAVRDGVACGVLRKDGSAAVPLAYEQVINLGGGAFSAKEFSVPVICDEDGNLVTVVLVGGALPETTIPDGTEVELVNVPATENAPGYALFKDKATGDIRSMNLFGEITGNTFHIETGSGQLRLITGQGPVDGYWDEIMYPKEGAQNIIRVMKDGKYGYFRPDGTALTPVEYDKAGSFSDGAAIVWKGTKWYIIDTNGNIVF